MSELIVAPYGSWKSLITADLVVAGSVGLGQITLDGDDVYWVEARPSEGGRQVIVRLAPDGERTDVTPAPFNARTRVHEYGGRCYVVSDRALYFSNFADGRLYRQDSDSAPRPITPEAALRYADPVIDPPRGRLICVREDHTTAGREAVNTIVSVDLAGDDAGGRILVSGSDFYSGPRLSPDGARLAWLAWDHPNMPWDGTELWVGDVRDDGTIGRATRVAGGAEESICQPEWSPDGTLYFVSDRTGWWNLYRWRVGRVEPLHPMEAEFGLPDWVFGRASYAVESPGRLVCAYNVMGTWRLAMLDTKTLQLDPISLPYTEILGVRAAPGQAFFVAGAPAELPAVVRLDLATRASEVLCWSGEVDLDPSYLSTPQAIEFPTGHGLTAHAFFYPPRNRDASAPAGERPPLLIMSHGGPTAATSTVLDLEIQYWTSRGIAVLDVNYGGSTGYGRAYRQRLDGQWGIVDVEDCVNGARYLVERDLADGERLTIRGGSAGGYTTLCALTFCDLFKAGASYYGVGDLEALTRETHKFESHYLDRLIGPYPERRDLYLARSPIYFTDRLSCALILFQGQDDKIVPPNQADTMYQAVRAKRLPVAYLVFEGEGHGFRRAANIKRSLEAELYFYARVFGFDLADPVEPVHIENIG